ncbi:MAG: acetyl-CoA carboxylase biotin carboxyl carrier protein subunit [Pseudomonadota bacterium]
MQSLISELRAMLLQFERSPLKDLYFRRGDCAVFLARPGGGANPLLAAEAVEAAVSPALPPVALRAPHLGLFQPACAVGETVAAGAVLGTIDVLGRCTEVRAEVAGRIAGVLAAANDLVEYGDALIELETAA